MTKEEFLKLRMHEVIYRDDGSIGRLTSEPQFEQRKIENWRDDLVLSFEDKLKHPYGPSLYLIFVRASDHEKWHLLNIGTCTNALAVARYAFMAAMDLYEQLSERTLL